MPLKITRKTPEASEAASGVLMNPELTKLTADSSKVCAGLTQESDVNLTVLPPGADPEADNLPEQILFDELRDFDPKNDPNSLLGNRWLCRGGSMVIAGQSGIGKSSFLMQMAMALAVGKPFFGISPARPLMSIVLQAENDLGDLAEAFQGVYSHLNFSEGDSAACKANTAFYREHIRTGDRFINVAKKLIVKHSADIVFADPLLAYVGDDISKIEVVSDFLRAKLNPVLHETGAIWVWMHHTGKPKDASKDQTDKDMSYVAFGSSDIVNWAREVAVLAKASTSDDVYTFTLCKRGKRAGMTNGQGKYATSIFLRHSGDGISWLRATEPPKPKKRSPTEKLAEVEEKVAEVKQDLGEMTLDEIMQMRPAI